jgi:predicted phosphodiesterase
MIIGIVTDIHDALGPLSNALTLLREKGVERIVTLGDAFETCRFGEPGAEVAHLLQDAGAIGVWGNHDFGLSHEVGEEILGRADPELISFASRLQPQIVLEDCRFSHIEPWKDSRRVEHLWDFDGVPDTGERAQRSFQAVPERILFVGHFHAQLVVRQEGRMAWDGDQPIRLLRPDRYLVLVPAVLYGWCAMFDTAQSELTAVRCGKGRELG